MGGSYKLDELLMTVKCINIPLNDDSLFLMVEKFS